MATALQEEEEFTTILQCPICLESFTRPKVLPCGHTYCASCLQSHINNKVTNIKPNQACFPCPVCKADTLLVDPNICIEQWAESFPVNSIVSALMDVSERKKVYHCDQCIKRGKESLAKFLCKDCDRSMCMSCKICHDEFPSMSQHYMINVCNTANCLAKHDISNIEACQRHCNKHIQFFCGDHKTLCCSSCVALEHAKCKKVLAIEDMLKSFDVKKKSEEIELKMSKFMGHLNPIIRMIKSNYGTIQKDKDDILEHIYSLKAQVMTKLQKCEGNVIESLESKYSSENSNLQNHEIKGRSLITAIDNDLTKLNLVMTHGSEVQKVSMLTNLDQNQDRYFRAILEYQNDIKDVNLRFDVDETFSTFLNTISKLGKISVIGKDVDKSSACLKAVDTNLWPISRNLPMISHLKERTAMKVTEFNVKTLRDKSKCHISHILLLEDTRMLLVDHNNYKVKLFGEDYRCQESVKFEGFPWFACSLSDTEVAVTIPCQKTIQIIEIEDVMRKTREITTRFECWGIAVANDLLVITTSGHVVLILDIDGTEIKAVHTKNYHSEKYLDPRFIKVDTTNLAMYVSYPTAKKLVAYSMTWDVLFTYRNQDSAGIDTDREGNIYLCVSDLHCVQQISEEGKLIKTLISKKTENMTPLGITFFRNTDTFFLTYGGCDVVEVYELRVSPT